MLSKRLTEEIPLIYMHDPALNVFDHKEIAEWLVRGRNIEELDLTRCEEPPTIFYCDPLKVKFEHLIMELANGDSNACWHVFANHVNRADNFSENGKPLLEWDTDRVIKKDCRGKVTTDVIADIATTIMRKSEQVSSGFIVPPTFLRQRIVSQQIRVKGAGGKSVSEDPSKSESNQNPQEETATPSN
jgi:hypothetical protein